MAGTVQLEEGYNGLLTFFIEEDGKRSGELVGTLSGNILRAEHTEVVPEAEGKGLAKQLLQAMVNYVRNNGLKVIANCPYVRTQFQRHPDEYQDIWER